MDPLFAIADAVVSDLETVKNGPLGLAFFVMRDEIPDWELSRHTPEENNAARVYVATIAEEGEHDTRAEFAHRATVQLAVGAWKCVDKSHRDQLSSLAQAIANRYRHRDTRTLTYASDQLAIITNAVRNTIYDAELLRSEGAFMGSINLTVEFRTSTSNEA